MITNEAQIRQNIINHIKRHNRAPSYFSVVGCDWETGKPILDAMIDDGTLVWEERISKKGRKSSVLRLPK